MAANEKILNTSEIITKEAARRRTFAIISHPDAGKTTLTEKFLLYGGSINLAGSVTAKKKQRETASDWMELEKKRGISISSTVLQFDYDGFRLNLLDTPGHKDFSEDTYRVLMAVDAVVMVIDAVNGIESQTLKLFEICRKRKIPIFTFMNKLDRPAKEPLDLLDQIEKMLGLKTFPVNWPLGNGVDFKGVYNRMEKAVYLFERVPGGAYKAPMSIHDLSDPSVKNILSERAYKQAVEEIEMLDGAHEGFNHEEVLRGITTPVLFGSAANNFGVEMLLKWFLKYSTPPIPRKSKERIIPLNDPAFSAFVFKVQTNMNPLHRDRVVFARVCSGEFSRDMKVYYPRLDREINLSDSYNLFGRDREVVDKAYPGDIIGYVSKLDFRVGDTVSTDKNIVFDEIPRFAPECFAYIHNKSSATEKRFRKGFEHLLAEDIVQVFFLKRSGQIMPLLGVVGPLQFEVMQYRLKDEYQSETTLDIMPWKILRWVESAVEDEELLKRLPRTAALAQDDQERRVLLFCADWSLNSFIENNPTIKLLDTPPQTL